MLPPYHLHKTSQSVTKWGGESNDMGGYLCSCVSCRWLLSRTRARRLYYTTQLFGWRVKLVRQSQLHSPTSNFHGVLQPISVRCSGGMVLRYFGRTTFASSQREVRKSVLHTGRRTSVEMEEVDDTSMLQRYVPTIRPGVIV